MWKEYDSKKQLIGEFFSDNMKKRAAIYATSTMGYELVFFVNGQIVDHQSLIQKYHQAETKAENWIKENYQ